MSTQMYSEAVNVLLLSSQKLRDGVWSYRCCLESCLGYRRPRATGWGCWPVNGGGGAGGLAMTRPGDDSERLTAQLEEEECPN